MLSKVESRRFKKQKGLQMKGSYKDDGLIFRPSPSKVSSKRL